MKKVLQPRGLIMSNPKDVLANITGFSIGMRIKDHLRVFTSDDRNSYTRQFMVRVSFYISK